MKLPGKKSYDWASAQYKDIGVDTEKAISMLRSIPISLPCWQGDDVTGFEKGFNGHADGGIQATGNYPGRTRDMEELMQDLQVVLEMVPGSHRISLHAMYGNFGSDAVDRDGIEIQHFQAWIDWAASLGIGLDFNATCFAHPKAGDGYTLSHHDATIRDFWIEHVKRCRLIGSEIGKQLASPSGCGL